MIRTSLFGWIKSGYKNTVRQIPESEQIRTVQECGHWKNMDDTKIRTSGFQHRPDFFTVCTLANRYLVKKSHPDNGVRRFVGQIRANELQCIKWKYLPMTDF